VYRLPLLLFTVTLAVAACTGTPSRPPAPGDDGLDTSARALVAQHDYLGAAQLYLSTAKTAPANQRNGLRLRAAALLAEGRHWDELDPVLAALPKDVLDPSQRTQYRLLGAQLALARRQPDTALELLALINAPETLADRGKHYYQLRAAAYAQAGNPLESARQLIWLDGVLDDPAEKLKNQYAIWEQLSGLSDAALSAMKSAAPPDALSGWMDLVLLTRAYRTDRARWTSELDRWRGRYPHHAAEEVLLPDLLSQVGQFASKASRIAVLLPLTGSAADAAAAVRDGILAAFFQGAPPRPELRFYDTAGNVRLIWSTYQRAIAEGADFVIGPLLKENIQALARSGLLPVPVLALNRADDIPADRELALYQFGLAPEDEARQVARRAIADGRQRLVALVPENAWGRRVLDAFRETFSELGGTLLEAESYSTEGADFSGPIRAALNLEDSKIRARALQRLLGEKLEFEPRRRQDVQGVLLLAFPREARQIKPQLRFHHSGNLPVYSTSHVYAASDDPAIDRDLDGLQFCDIPWALDQEGPWATQRRAVDALWPGRGQRFQRLFALGFDAYQLVPWLDTMDLPGFAQFPGATGILSLDDDKQLHRTLEWARFNRGQPEKIRAPLNASTEGQHEPEVHRQ
jgi:outer membrane PBP1 activator LpoA protein